MRLATRLWLALVVAVVLVLTAGVMIRVRSEQRVLLDVTLRDRRFFAHALHTALSRQHGSSDPLGEALRMLDHEEVAQAHIVARLVSTNGTRNLPPPRLGGEHRAHMLRGEVVVVEEHDAVLTYVPLEPQGALVLELSEPQAVPTLLRSIGLQSLAVQTLALAMLAAVVSFALVRWLIGRPLERLASLARRIGNGDFAVREEPVGAGEVTILATEMNHMAERLGLAQRAVEEADHERVAALEQLRHADRLRTVGQLASSLAHELGTPLNVVAGHARLIEQDPVSTEETRESALAILEQTVRMTTILRDLLDFARRRGPQRSVLALNDVAQRAIETLAPIARKAKVRLSIEHEDAQVCVFADPQQLLQVLTNLVMNAMQAMPQGGLVRVVIDRKQTAPPIGVHGPAGWYARMAVEDRGVGIAPEDLPHLFEPFFTRKAEGEGTGLGLAVVAGIVQDHGGWIAVESKQHEGSRFEVYLPERVTQEQLEPEQQTDAESTGDEPRVP